MCASVCGSRVDRRALFTARRVGGPGGCRGPGWVGEQCSQRCVDVDDEGAVVVDGHLDRGVGSDEDVALAVDAQHAAAGGVEAERLAGGDALGSREH